MAPRPPGWLPPLPLQQDKAAGQEQGDALWWLGEGDASCIVVVWFSPGHLHWVGLQADRPAEEAWTGPPNKHTQPKPPCLFILFSHAPT